MFCRQELHIDAISATQKRQGKRYVELIEPGLPFRKTFHTNVLWSAQECILFQLNRWLPGWVFPQEKHHFWIKSLLQCAILKSTPVQTKPDLLVFPHVLATGCGFLKSQFTTNECLVSYADWYFLSAHPFLVWLSQTIHDCNRNSMTVSDKNVMGVWSEDLVNENAMTTYEL